MSTITIGNRTFNVTQKTVRSSNGTVHTYYSVKMTITHDPVTRRQIQKEFTAGTVEALKEKLTQALCVNHTLTETNILVRDWLLNWFESYRHALRKGTQGCYYSRLHTTIIPILGNIRLCDLSLFHVQEMINTLLARNMNPGTVKAIVNLLKLSLDPAVHQRILLYNPCEDVRIPRTPFFEILPLCDRDIACFLSEVENFEHGNLYAVMLFSGMRISETLGLAWPDVDFDRKCIRVHQQLATTRIYGTNKWETYLQPSTKNGRPRIIYPPAICFDYLKREKLRQESFRDIMGADRINNPNDLVFTTPTGEYLHHNLVRKQYKTLVARINRPELRLHDLRHTAASIVLALSGDIRMVQQLLGHSSLAMAMWYTHTTETAMENLAQKTQEFYRNLHLSINPRPN